MLILLILAKINMLKNCLKQYFFMLTDLMKRFISQYNFSEQEAIEIKKEEIPKIKTNKVTEKLAVFYEKIRNAIDYKEEHLIRQFAIKRIIKRYPLNNLDRTAELAKQLLYELVQARYFDDNEVPESRIDEIKLVLDKYILISQEIKGPYSSDFKHWLLAIMSCEIEEIIISPRKINALMELMYRTVEPKINLVDFDLNDETRAQQIFIAINKSLMKADKDLVDYRLIKSLYPQWKNNEKFDVEFFNTNIKRIRKQVQDATKHPLNKILVKKVKKHSVLFNTLHSVIDNNLDNLEELFTKKDKLSSEIKKVADANHKATKQRVNRAVVKTIIYLFITKVTLALIIEIPFDKIVEGGINYLAIGINILMPPLLMFLLMVTFSLPAKKNSKKIVEELEKVINDPDDILLMNIKTKKAKKSILMKVFQFLYLTIFFISFSGIIYFLYRLHFNIVSGVLFMLFLSLVSYFGMQIRRSALSIVILKQRKGFFVSLFELFAYPILKAGKWFTHKFDEYNLFVLFFDLIIESPLKSFMFIMDAWFEFMRQKEEEL